MRIAQNSKFVQVLKKIETICVCGAGTMGRGIAQLAAQSGYKTMLYDVHENMLHEAKENVFAVWENLLKKNRLSEAEKASAVSNISFTKNLEECVADVIIEAIEENKEIKSGLFCALEDINDSKTLIVSNTSSISISELAHTFKFPRRFAGLHFFNPAPVMRLVEIIQGEATDKAVIDTLVCMAQKMGRTPVVCKDAPGFIVNRVARHYYLESLYLAEHFSIDIRDIDSLLESSGFRMGPFSLMDLIGIETNYTVSNIVWEALGKPARLEPSPMQKLKIMEGNIGKKSGKGFYPYE